MIEIKLCLFNFVIEFYIRRKRKEDKDFLDVNYKEDVEGPGGNGGTSEEDCSVDLSDIEKRLVEQPSVSEISKRAEEYAEELKNTKVDENGLYDYDEKEVWKPRFSDVEIITEDYEKEVEDKIEGRV